MEETLLYCAYFQKKRFKIKPIKCNKTWFYIKFSVLRRILLELLWPNGISEIFLKIFLQQLIDREVLTKHLIR